MLKLTPLYILGIAAGSAMFTPVAMADDSNHYYFGLNAGQAQSQFDNQSTTNSLLGTSTSLGSFSNDSRPTSYKLFAGYQFNRNFALEAGYFNLGKSTYSIAAPAGTLNGEYQIEGVNLDLVGALPLGDQWSVLARLGTQYANTRDAFSGPGLPAYASVDNSQRANNLKVGLGLQYAINSSWLLRGEAERYRLRDGVGNTGDVNVYSLSLVFPFGHVGAH